MPDIPRCPRHPQNELYPLDAPVRRCLHPGCNFTHRGPAPDRDYVSRTERDAAKWERMHTERPSRRVSAYSGDEFDADAERG